MFNRLIMKRHDEAKEKRKQIFMSTFIVLIMSLSVLGYMVGREGEDVTKYNGFKLFKVDNQWATKISGKQYLFYFHPTQVERINVSKSIIEKINQSMQIYLTSDENSTNKEAIALTQFEISNSWSQNNKYIVDGFTKNNKYSKPVITCLNATSYIPVLMFEKYNVTEISEENKCIFLRARSDQDFLALKDRLIYGVLGIIN